MIAKLQYTLVPAMVALTACGSSGGGGGDSSVSYFFGSTDPDASANGLPFAIPGNVVKDVETQDMTVRLVRFETDYATGETVLIGSDETVTFESGGTDTGDFTTTYKGETVLMSGGEGVDALANGQTLYAFGNTAANVSGTVVLFIDEADAPSGTPGFDSGGFFAYGFETDPDTVAATAGSVTYVGDFIGFGQELNPDGSIYAAGIFAGGTITLNSDFGNGAIDGTLTGTVFAEDGEVDFTGVIAETDIAGNGYASTVAITCVICTGSNSEIGGVFYGDTAQETSGVIGFDVTTTEGAYVGAAGYTATD